MKILSLIKQLSVIQLLMIWNIVITILVIVVLVSNSNLRAEQSELTNRIGYNTDIIEMQNRVVADHKEIITQCINSIDTLNDEISGIGGLEGEIDELQYDTDSLEWDVYYVKQDLANIEWDIYELQTDLSKLSRAVYDLQLDVQWLKFR